jgi:hypothetical protein
MILIGLLLLVEGLSTALWIARIVPMLPALGAVVIVLGALRGLTGAMQTMGGASLLMGRRDTIKLCQLALIASALLTTLEIGARLSPNDLDPTWRWWLTSMYWIYALAAIAWLGRHGDGQVRGDKNQEVKDPDDRRLDVGD